MGHTRLNTIGDLSRAKLLLRVTCEACWWTRTWRPYELMELLGRDRALSELRFRCSECRERRQIRVEMPLAMG